MAEKLNAVLIIEMLGKPPEHIKQIMSDLIDKLGAVQDTKILQKKIADPKKVEENVFTVFSEVEIETSFPSLMNITFSFMPSHIEIITPEELKIRNSDLNSFFNELMRRLHQYDEIAKAILLERQAIINKFQETQHGQQQNAEVKNQPTEKSTKEKTAKKQGKKKK